MLVQRKIAQKQLSGFADKNALIDLNSLPEKIGQYFVGGMGEAQECLRAIGQNQFYTMARAPPGKDLTMVTGSCHQW
eukprot:3957443-Lingulodinium_polyedra.AAC.1